MRVEPSDENLIQDYQAGKIIALEQLYLKYQTPLFNYIRRWISDSSQAEDILQEVFVKVMNKAKSFMPAGNGSFASWLYVITLNLCRDKQRVTKTQSINYEPAAPDNQEFYGRADDEKLQQALNTLSPEQKEVVLLRTYSGLSFKAISKIQNVPLNTVLARMHYAINNLRQRLGVLKVLK